MNQSKTNIFTKEFFILCFASFCVAYTAFALNAAVPLYINFLGGTANVTGLLNTSFTICACLFRLGGGWLADRFGRKRIIVLGGMVFSIMTLLFIWVSALPLLIIIRGAQGAGFALMSIGCSTALVDVLPQDRFGEGLGYFSLASTVASSVAAAAAIAIAEAKGYGHVFGSTALVAAAGFLIPLLLSHYESEPAFQEERSAAIAAQRESGEKMFSLKKLFEPQAVMPAVVFTLFSTGVAISYVYMSLYAVDTGIGHPGLYFTFSSIFAVFARIIGGKLADRNNVIPGLLAGFLICIASYLVLFLPDPHSVWYCAAGALFGISGGFANPILNRLAVHGVPADRRGAASATFSVSNDIGTGLGGLLWGATITAWGYIPSFWTVVVWMAASTVFMTVYYTFRRKKLQVE